MKFLAVATLFFAAGLAAPTDAYPPPPPTYNLPANGGGNPPHGNVPPPTGNKPGNGNGNGNENHAVQSRVCPPGLYSNPQCCATWLLGVIGVNCSAPPSTPQDGHEFRSICAEEGAEALCCAVPVAGQALLCQPVAG